MRGSAATRRELQPIEDATGASYDVTADDLGELPPGRGHRANPGGVGTADSLPTGVVVPAAPTVVTAPTISGDAIVGSTWTVDPGSWSDPTATFSYVW